MANTEKNENTQPAADILTVKRIEGLTAWLEQRSPAQITAQITNDMAALVKAVNDRNASTRTRRRNISTAVASVYITLAAVAEIHGCDPAAVQKIIDDRLEVPKA